MALGTAGPGTEIIFRANEEYSLSYFPLKLLCFTVVPCIFLFKPYRDVAENFLHGVRRASMGIKDLQCIRHSPLFRVFYFDCPWLGRRKKFEIKALRWLKNTILGLAFANTVFYKSTILLIFEAEVTEKTSSRILSPL